MYNLFICLLLSVCLDTVYAYSNDGYMSTNRNTKSLTVLSLTSILYYLQSTFRNPEFWKMNRAMMLCNTQIWGIYGGEVY